ncbi:hypothetical protein VKT23_019465 [Stygiomarasmius scandens]|uniref:Xylanolytic transcriptional activator regulatory domain-containing protein n=1 Tax=Marasmiellus scandens TaxID=2682957 RepID=A0ABR1IL96_9AGAR
MLLLHRDKSGMFVFSRTQKTGPAFWIPALHRDPHISADSLRIAVNRLQVESKTCTQDVWDSYKSLWSATDAAGGVEALANHFAPFSHKSEGDSFAKPLLPPPKQQQQTQTQARQIKAMSVAPAPGPSYHAESFERNSFAYPQSDERRRVHEPEPEPDSPIPSPNDMDVDDTPHAEPDPTPQPSQVDPAPAPAPMDLVAMDSLTSSVPSFNDIDIYTGSYWRTADLALEEIESEIPLAVDGYGSFTGFGGHAFGFGDFTGTGATSPSKDKDKDKGKEHDIHSHSYTNAHTHTAFPLPSSSSTPIPTPKLFHAVPPTTSPQHNANASSTGLFSLNPALTYRNTTSSSSSTLPSDMPMPDSLPHSHSIPNANPNADPNLHEYELPPLHILSALLDVYYTHVHPTFPVMPERTWVDGVLASSTYSTSATDKSSHKDKGRAQGTSMGLDEPTTILLLALCAYTGRLSPGTVFQGATSSASSSSSNGGNTGLSGILGTLGVGIGRSDGTNNLPHLSSNSRSNANTMPGNMNMETLLTSSASRIASDLWYEQARTGLNRLVRKRSGWRSFSSSWSQSQSQPKLSGSGEGPSKSNAGVEPIQICLLLGMRDYGKGNESQAWGLVGMAVRMGQELELDMLGTRSYLITTEAEVAKTKTEAMSTSPETTPTATTAGSEANTHQHHAASSAHGHSASSLILDVTMTTTTTNTSSTLNTNTDAHQTNSTTSSLAPTQNQHRGDRDQDRETRILHSNIWGVTVLMDLVLSLQLGRSPGCVECLKPGSLSIPISSQGREDSSNSASTSGAASKAFVGQGTGPLGLTSHTFSLAQIISRINMYLYLGYGPMVQREKEREVVNETVTVKETRTITETRAIVKPSSSPGTSDPSATSPIVTQPASPITNNSDATPTSSVTSVSTSTSTSPPTITSSTTSVSPPSPLPPHEKLALLRTELDLWHQSLPMRFRVSLGVGLGGFGGTGAYYGGGSGLGIGNWGNGGVDGPGGMREVERREVLEVNMWYHVAVILLYRPFVKDSSITHASDVYMDAASTFNVLLEKYKNVYFSSAHQQHLPDSSSSSSMSSSVPTISLSNPNMIYLVFTVAIAHLSGYRIKVQRYRQYQECLHSREREEHARREKSMGRGSPYLHSTLPNQSSNSALNGPPPSPPSPALTLQTQLHLLNCLEALKAMGGTWELARRCWKTLDRLMEGEGMKPGGYAMGMMGQTVFGGGKRKREEGGYRDGEEGQQRQRRSSLSVQQHSLSRSQNEGPPTNESSATSYAAAPDRNATLAPAFSPASASVSSPSHMTGSSASPITNWNRKQNGGNNAFAGPGSSPTSSYIPQSLHSHSQSHQVQRQSSPLSLHSQLRHTDHHYPGSSPFDLSNNNTNDLTHNQNQNPSAISNPSFNLSSSEWFNDLWENGDVLPDFGGLGNSGGIGGDMFGMYGHNLGYGGMVGGMMSGMSTADPRPNNGNGASGFGFDLSGTGIGTWDGQWDDMTKFWGK